MWGSEHRQDLFSPCMRKTPAAVQHMGLGTGRRHDGSPHTRNTSKEGSCCCQHPGTALLYSNAFFRNIRRDKNGPVWHQRSLPASLTRFFATPVLLKTSGHLGPLPGPPFRKIKLIQSSSEIEPNFTRHLLIKPVTLHRRPPPTFCYSLWLHSRGEHEVFPSRLLLEPGRQ